MLKKQLLRTKDKVLSKVKEDIQKTAKTADIDRRGPLLWIHRMEEASNARWKDKKYGRGTLREGQNNEENPKHRAKIKLSLCLIKYHANYVTYKSGGMAPCILKLDSRYRSAVSFMCQSYPNKMSPITHRTASFVDPRTGLDTMKRNISYTLKGSLVIQTIA